MIQQWTNKSRKLTVDDDDTTRKFVIISHNCFVF